VQSAACRGKQHCEDTGKKDAIERSGPADRSDGRAKAAHLVEIGLSAPTSVPRPPAIWANGGASLRDSRSATAAVTKAGMNTGTAIPSPGTVSRLEVC
jgi:hypothetical protein